MNVEFIKSERIQDDMDLLDDLLDGKLSSEQFKNNELVVNKICESVDTMKRLEEGFILMSVTFGDRSTLMLIDKTSTNTYRVTRWKTKERVEKGLEVKIHQTEKFSVEDWLSGEIDASGLSNRFIDEIRTAGVIESLSGYTFSRKKVRDYIKFMSQSGTSSYLNQEQWQTDKYAELRSIFDNIRDTVFAKRNEVRAQISNFAQRTNCEKLSLVIGHNGINLDKSIYVGRIEEVKQTANRRVYHLRYYYSSSNDAGVRVENVVKSVNSGVKGNPINLRNMADIWISDSKPYYSSNLDAEIWERIPYNFIDRGRVFVGIPRGGNLWNIVVSQDPRIQENNIEHMNDVIARYINVVVPKGLKLSGTRIRDSKDKDYTYEAYENLIRGQDLKPVPKVLKALKMMTDEYKYVSKKQKAEGQDVNITDRVKYNHEEGKVSYGDFSISIGDEMIKNRVYQLFEQHLVNYYRKEVTEEEILNKVLDEIFSAIGDRVGGYSKEEFTIPIEVNGTIKLEISAKITKNKSKLVYLNGQRFNKNEILTVIREMTCYREQAAADMFIKNIGKMGLSVYIGCTSGYEITSGGKTRLYRFKKLKGRSSYSLVLDTIEIPVKGKTLINMFYKNFIGDPVYNFTAKIPTTIFRCVGSTLDYAKYKFLIDSSYEAFKRKSEEFLDKKIADVEGEHCVYWNKKGHRAMSGVRLTGTSGHEYVIAYDNKDSYVFMDPDVKDKPEGGKTVFEEGKYICMIDQSNIKSNIGYDTVISKLLALRNDSVIAGTIYNLEEELNG